MIRDRVRLDSAAVNKIRVEAGLTREELAAKAGLSSVTTGRVVAGKLASLPSAAAVARALGVPFKEVLSGIEG